MSELRTDLLEPYEGFGKYESELNLCEVLDALDADEEAGDVEVSGSYRLYTWSSDPDKAIEDIGGTTGNFVVAILKTDSQGFVTAEYYESYEEATRVWARVMEAVTAEEELNEDGDETETEQ